MCQLEIGQLIILSSFKDRKKPRLRSKVGEGWQKTTQLINTSHTIRSCSITSLCYWTNSCLWGSPGPRLAISPTPLTFVFCHSLGNLKNVLQLPIPSKQQFGLYLRDLLVHILAVPCTSWKGSPQVLTMLRSLGYLHDPTLSQTAGQ